MAQGVQVGLRLLQVRESLIKSHPCWAGPLVVLAAVASSLPALVTQLAQGFGGSLYHLRPGLDAQLERRRKRWREGEDRGEDRILRGM